MVWEDYLQQVETQVHSSNSKQAILQSFKEKIEDRLLLRDSYKNVFENEDGQRVIRHLMKVCGLLKPKITTDTNTLLFQQGQRHIVLSILNILGSEPQQIIEQIQESINENDD